MAYFDQVYDQTTKTYFDSWTNLYMNPHSKLYYDFQSFPPTTHFWNDITQSMMKLKETSQKNQSSVSTAGTTEDEKGVPSQFVLERASNLEEIHYLGEGFGDSEDKSRGTFTVGRSSKNYIHINDVEVSKVHAKITWERLYWENTFWVMDTGSTNGTFINGVRLSEPRVASEERKFSLQDKDKISFGTNSTYVVRRLTAEEKQLFLEQKAKEKVIKTTTNHELRQAWKLTKEEREERDKSASKYVDRAALRRDTYQDSPEEVPYIDRPVDTRPKEIVEDNKGFQLLKAMGWKKGDGLGKDSSGITAPIQALKNMNRQGLGFGSK